MNTRFAVATHILTYLAACDGQPTTSRSLAASINTNPSFVRRLLSHLNQAGLTKARIGTGGGAMLARPATDITLADVYLATRSGDLLEVPADTNPACPVAIHLQRALQASIGEAERALTGQFARTSIADVVGAMTRASSVG